MQRIRIDLDQRTFEKLARMAGEERRPIQWQAEVIIRRAVGTQAPEPISGALIECVSIGAEPQEGGQHAA